MRNHSYRIFVLAWLPVLLALPGTIDAQPLQWELIAGGQPLSWTAKRPWPADSIRFVALDALSNLHGQGFLFARIDSYRVDPTRAALYVTLGAPAVIETIRLVGAHALDSHSLLAMLKTQPGLPFDALSVESDAQTLVSAYAEEGYHFARVSIGELEVSASNPRGIGLTFLVNEGTRPVLQGVALLGAKRTRRSFVRRAVGLKGNMPVLHFDPVLVKERLEESEIFNAVGTPALAVGADSALVIQIPVAEAPPGAFDLALGYERDDKGGGALVGSGHLALRNLFGYGRTLSLTLNRAPGQVSRINVRARDPFAFGFPVSLGARFEGLQQDSTYGKRAYELELGYRFEGRMSVFSTLVREVTRPGLAGLRIVGSRQRIPVATALFAGLGIRVQTVDSRINPRRGFVVETGVESGRKDRSLRVARTDTTEESTRLQQARLRASARLFIPTARRQTLVLGGETMLLRSRELDESDLFRFGGANSLRGYDEDEFRVPFATRLLVEYRYLLDEESHVLTFVDLGYVDASRTSAPLRGFYPGYGVGFQLETDAGRINVTAAASTEAPAEVRAHLSISLGL